MIDRNEEVAKLSRELLIWMVAGEAEVFSDARIASVVATSFKIAAEWKDYKDALDNRTENEDNGTRKRSVAGGYGIV